MNKATIHVVDDDQAVRESIEWLIDSVGLNIRTYASADEFLAQYQEDVLGCLILDVRMPGISGLDLQQILKQRGLEIPIIFITGHGDVPMAVRALKNGAVDFIEKPFSDQTLLETIQNAVKYHCEQLEKRSEFCALQARYRTLTSREQEVMTRVVAGQSNRDIAETLGISIKTVEVHRAKVMEKMQAGSIAELVRMGVILQQESA